MAIEPTGDLSSALAAFRDALKVCEAWQTWCGVASGDIGETAGATEALSHIHLHRVDGTAIREKNDDGNEVAIEEAWPYCRLSLTDRNGWRIVASPRVYGVSGVIEMEFGGLPSGTVTTFEEMLIEHGNYAEAVLSELLTTDNTLDVSELIPVTGPQASGEDDPVLYARSVWMVAYGAASQSFLR